MNQPVTTRHPLARVLAGALCALLPLAALASDPFPSGEVQLGQSILEPAYNDANGSLIYILTPIHAPLKLKPTTPLAPLYVIVYPNSVSGAIGTVNCSHQPVDNCPDHGPAIAGLAEAMQPSVYQTSGVWGHDHILAAPPAPPPSGGDFNVIWEPIAVLFTDDTHITHIKTLSALMAAKDAGYVQFVPLLAASFYCAVVAASPYNRGTPVPPAPDTP